MKLASYFIPHKVTVWKSRKMTIDHYFWTWRGVLKFMRTEHITENGVSIYQKTGAIFHLRRLPV